MGQKGRSHAARRTSHPPEPAVWKSALSPARRWLVERMQRLNYGRITLIVAASEPVTDPPPRVYCRRRLSGPNRARQERGLEDFILKDQVLKLFEELDRIGSGIVTIEVRDGLPSEVMTDETGRA